MSLKQKNREKLNTNTFHTNPETKIRRIYVGYVEQRTSYSCPVNDIYHLPAPIFINFFLHYIIINDECCSCYLLLSTVIIYHEYPKCCKDDDEYGTTLNVCLSHCLARIKLGCCDTFYHVNCSLSRIEQF
jgi:hypothetical protein